MTETTPTTRGDERSMIVRGVPPRLKGKIARRVLKRKSNLNDELVTVLAFHYGVEFTPSGVTSPTTEFKPYPNIVLRVPAELKRRVALDAAERQESIRNVVVEILAGEFRVPFVPTGRWHGHTRATA